VCSAEKEPDGHEQGCNPAERLDPAPKQEERDSNGGHHDVCARYGESDLANPTKVSLRHIEGREQPQYSRHEEDNRQHLEGGQGG
jgi:hypothetical protein